MKRLARASLLAIAACAGPSPALDPGSDLDPRIITDLAAREHLTEPEARARADEIIRTAAAYEREHPPLPAARVERLRRAALVELWLRDHFEPEHQVDDIPESRVAELLAQRDTRNRHFHPELRLTCQAVFVPAEGASADDEKWRTDTALFAAPLERRLERYVGDLRNEQDCVVFERIVVASGAKTVGKAVRKLENFTTVADGSLDADFVERVQSVSPPALVPGFFTKFGYHVVFVPRMLPATLEDGSMPEPELAAARDRAFREAYLVAWRAEELGHTIDTLRSDTVVRTIAPERP